MTSSILANALGRPVIGYQIAQSAAVATDASGNMPGSADTLATSSQGSQLLTVTITPKSASSILVIDAMVYGAPSVSSYMNIAVFRDSGANAIGQAIINGAALINVPYLIRVRFMVATGSTAQTTFKLRFGLDRAGTMTVNGSAGSRMGGGAFYSSIDVTEYAQ